MVKYDDDEFPGEITNIDGDDIEVNVMIRSARPVLEDRLFHNKDGLHNINPPTVAGNRGQFWFTGI